MKVKLWGTRGSLASAGSDTTHYGGNTSCVTVQQSENHLLILDAGTGIRKLGNAISPKIQRIDILITHLHLDHILGLGFFEPLYDAEREVHIYGPRAKSKNLYSRLSGYLSPPLFPVHLRDLPCKLFLHEVGNEHFSIGDFKIMSNFVCHPGLTLGYRIEMNARSIAYIPDHEPALGAKEFPLTGDWTSGYELAHGADLLIHDSQYTTAEYLSHLGWGHSSIQQALQFASLANIKNFMPFHHDPSHSDAQIDAMLTEAKLVLQLAFNITACHEGAEFDVG